MGSDIARVSFDPSRKYSGVVMQQGRVFLEADWNEQQTIAAEELRAEALDIVGVAGTSDDGYCIGFSTPASPPNFDFTIGAGSMFVGGLRVDTRATTYFTQPDWLTPPPPNPTPPASEYIVLHLAEQEVGAVEDHQLKDVALGGPDTGQRRRIVQHIERYATTAADCPSALKAQESQWTARGLTFHPATMRLKPQATLQVGFVTGATSDPCQPVAQGGYLDPDNQMIRVKVINSTQLVWGYDDASFLYRVDIVEADTLKLRSRPVDAAHMPQSGQAVEVLLSEVHLGHGHAYIAAPDGCVTTLSANYDPNSQRVKLTNSLTSPPFPAPPYMSGAPTPSGGTNPPIFLRIWNGLETFVPGTPIQLGNTGVTVTIGTETITPGVYWMFAVRPSTPQRVYPERYLAAPQPPEGPHQWICPLAIISWTATGVGSLVKDCRNKFKPLINPESTGGCCTYTVGDGMESFGMYASIQAAIDALPATGGEVCILPGHYYEHVLVHRSNVAIHGCGHQTHVYSPALRPQSNATTGGSGAGTNTGASSGDATNAGSGTASGGAPGAGSSPAPTESGLTAVFTVVACRHVALRSFAVHAADNEVGILLDRSPDTFKKPPVGPGGIGPEIIFREPGKGDADVEIERLVVTASTLPAMIAVSVTRLRIAENHIAMKDVESKWAAVYLSGDEISFERNRVSLRKGGDLVDRGSDVTQENTTDRTLATDGQAIALAPGGIQIAGPSQNLYVRENDIVGGRRNGITLGNFIILDANGQDTGTLTGVVVEQEDPCATEGSSQIPGATSDSKPSKIAAGGLIRNLHIDHNHIQDMGLCGIGPVGFFNLKQTLEVISLENLSITANIITRTLMRRVRNAEADGFILGYGAICIPDVQNLVVRDNAITDYGATPGAEVCGIFVLHGEMVEISRNQIRETRDLAGAADSTVGSVGPLQAGILVLLVTPPTQDSSAWTNALTQQNINGAFESNNNAIPNVPTYAPALPALRIQENVVRVALGLALEVFGIGPFAIVSNHFGSGGTVSVGSNAQSAQNPSPAQPTFDAKTVVGALTVAIINLGLAIEDVNPGYGYEKMYQNGSDNLDVAADLADASNGGVLFTNNICQLEAWASGVRGLSSVAILSLDHVLFANNQLWLDGPTLTAILDAFIFGVTTQVCTNRFQEARNYPVIYSGVTFGLVNITSQNISTYCLEVEGNSGYRGHNLVIASALCPDRKLAEANA
jgi:DNA-binding Lrp family transcriptional regulator